MATFFVWSESDSNSKRGGRFDSIRELQDDSGCPPSLKAPNYRTVLVAFSPSTVGREESIAIRERLVQRGPHAIVCTNFHPDVTKARSDYLRTAGIALNYRDFNWLACFLPSHREVPLVPKSRRLPRLYSTSVMSLQVF